MAINEFEEDTFIDGLLDEEYNKIKEQKGIVTQQSTDIDVTNEDEISKKIFDMTVEDRKNAEEIFNIFAPDIKMGKDRSEASKEALTKSLELKIAASRNLIELLKLKNKNSDGVKIGFFGNDVMSPKKVGIDLNNIKNNLDKK